MTKIRQLLNGYSTLSWRILVAVYMLAVTYYATWAFSQIQEVQLNKIRIEEKSKTLDRIILRIDQLHAKVDEIQCYLRDNR